MLSVGLELFQHARHLGGDRRLLRQQGAAASSIHELYGRLAIMTRLQAIIDQSKLPYRAGNVVTFSAVLLQKVTRPALSSPCN